MSPEEIKMSTSEVQQELAKLRKEVAALSTARKQKAPTETLDDHEASTDTEHENSGNAIKGQIEELTTLLQDEIREMPALTTLTVFALGVVMGRLLR